MLVYNTLSKQKEEFIPLKPNQVNMYVCGVTVYDECHLGHARAYLTFDVIRRYLEYKGYAIKAVQNFTDVDDKIIRRAQEGLIETPGLNLKDACQIITEKYIAAYFEVTDCLNIKRADIYPKATEHIPEIISLIEKLIKTNHAYITGGDVYFRVSSFASYGKISGQNIEDRESGARVDIDEQKEHPMDFALWKSSKPDEPNWASPWGNGRPGWHIECSAMSMKYLGDSFDIHGGGKDLIFPHHENEIAQSESATNKPYVKYWLHNGFLNIDKEKMSKSLGNFLTLKEVMARHKPEALRLFFLHTHYRSPVDFSEELIAENEKALERFYNVFRLTSESEAETCTPTTDTEKGINDYKAKFISAMDDDFNTSKAIAILFDLVKEINKIISKDGNKGAELNLFVNLLKELGQILGLFVNLDSLADNNDISAEVEALIQDRDKARAEKNWKLSDEIRDKLKAMNITIEDTPNGVRWKKD